MKVWTSNKLILVLVILASIILIAQYQNCAPAGSNGSAFSIGNSANNDTSTQLVLGPLAVPAGVQVSTPLSAQAVAQSGDSNISCHWTIKDSAQNVVTQSTTTAANFVCSYSGTAPAAVGTFTLELSVSNGAGQNASGSAAFTTSAAPPSLSVTATLSHAPSIVYANITTVTFTASVVSNYPKTFSVVIGQIDASNNRTPLPGCTFTSGPNLTTYAPQCSLIPSAAGTMNLYVTVNSSGTVTNDCVNGTTAGCAGSYSMTVSVYSGGGGGGGGGGGCFLKGTPVATPNGPVAIEKIKKGDKVYSYDVKTGKTVVGEVSETLVHKDWAYGEMELTDGTKFLVTPEHPFFMPNTKVWAPAGELKPGDLVLKGRDEKAAPVAIKSVSFKDKSKKAEVYNFQVKTFMNYYVNDVLVHNVKVLSTKSATPQ